MATRCAATKADGTPCRGFAGKGSRYCINHDPARWEIAQAGRSLGRERQAQARAAAPALSPEEAGPPPTTLADLRRLVSETLIAVQTGRVDPRRGSVVVALARTMGKLLRPEPGERSSTVAEGLERLPFPDLARKAVASLAACLDAGPEGDALRAELREMLAPRAEPAEPAVLEATGPGLARVLELLRQDPATPQA